MKYTIEFFEKKLGCIPNSKWVSGNLAASGGRFCALGHLGIREESYGNSINSEESNEMGQALGMIILSSDINRRTFGLSNEGSNKEFQAVMSTNDNDDVEEKTIKGCSKAKNRIMWALKNAKKLRREEAGRKAHATINKNKKNTPKNTPRIIDHLKNIKKAASQSTVQQSPSQVKSIQKKQLHN